MQSEFVMIAADSAVDCLPLLPPPYLLTAYRLPPTAYCLLPTAYCCTLTKWTNDIFSMKSRSSDLRGCSALDAGARVTIRSGGCAAHEKRGFRLGPPNATARCSKKSKTISSVLTMKSRARRAASDSKFLRTRR